MRAAAVLLAPSLASQSSLTSPLVVFPQQSEAGGAGAPKGGGLPQTVRPPRGKMLPAAWKVIGSECGLRTLQLSWRAASLQGRSCPELMVLAGAMEINPFVTNPNVHANRSLSRLKCKLLGRRQRKRKVRKLEVSAPGCTGAGEARSWTVMSLIASCALHRTFRSGLEEPQGSWAGEPLA